MIRPGLQSLPANRRKLIRRAAIALAVYAILGFLVLPPIVRAVATRQLSRQLDREVTIRKVRLNPFVFSASIQGLVIKDKDGEPFVSWDEVYVNLQLISFLGHPWVFREISATHPSVRVQMNKDRSLNFSDLIEKFTTKAPEAKPSKPLSLRVKRLHIDGATIPLTDLTPSRPFKRVIGPMNVMLVNFRTDPEHQNSYSFDGTTDAGSRLAGSGYFCLGPLRSSGYVSFEDLSLYKNAALYEDIVRFEIRDGTLDVRTLYNFEYGASNLVLQVSNAAVTVQSLRVGQTGDPTDLVTLPHLAVSGATVDAIARTGNIDSLSVTGACLSLKRGTNREINLVEVSRPASSGHESGGLQLLTQGVTNGVATLLNSTNLWKARLGEIHVEDCALTMDDNANARPAHLQLDQVEVTAHDVSNLPGTNATVSISMRWNTNGSIRSQISASLAPPSADVDLTLDRIDLHPLDPYLEDKINVFILGSKVGMDGRIQLRTTNASLPDVTFAGNAHLDDFSIVDGVLGEDLLKWSSIRFSDIRANLNPPAVDVGQIEVNDAFARLLIETNHTINLLVALHKDSTNEEAAPSPKAAADKKPEPAADKKPEPAAASPEPSAFPMPSVNVGSLIISNAMMRFTDRSLKPNVHVAVQDANGAITGLSSDPQHHADLHLGAKVDNVGPVEVNGTINPFSQTETNVIVVTVKDVDLTPTSPYSAKLAGYRIAKGKLNLDLVYYVQGSKLRSQNHIMLDQFTFGEKVESPEATKLPVRLAVAILKDRDGKIVLDVPVDGSLDDPEFKLHKVIAHALVNLLTKVVTSPFSALSSLFGGRGEEISYQDFVPGQAELLADNRSKLDALVKGLYERPGLQLEIEGSVNPDEDREGLRRVSLEHQMKTMQWQSLRKSVRSTMSPDQVVLTPEQRDGLVKKLYYNGLDSGAINLEKLQSDTNTASWASALPPRAPKSDKGATLLMPQVSLGETESGPPPPPTPAYALPPITDPLERAVLTTIPVSDADLQTLAERRAKAVLQYITQTGKVEADRLFLTEIKTGGVRSDGSRCYLQFR